MLSWCQKCHSRTFAAALRTPHCQVLPPSTCCTSHHHSLRRTKPEGSFWIGPNQGNLPGCCTSDTGPTHTLYTSACSSSRLCNMQPGNFACSTCYWIRPPLYPWDTFDRTSHYHGYTSRKLGACRLVGQQKVCTPAPAHALSSTISSPLRAPLSFRGIETHPEGHAESC